jgi:hypothetical protein
VPVAERNRLASRAQYADPVKQPKLKQAIAANNARRRKEDPVFKLATNKRTQIYNILKSGGHKYYDWLGCTGAQLREHFERQFEPGMTWENKGLGGWEIDHIIGLSAAKTKEEVLRLNHHTNLRPRWKSDNRQWRKNLVAVSELPKVAPDIVAVKTSKLQCKLVRYQQQLEACPANNKGLQRALQTNIELVTYAITTVTQLVAMKNHSLHEMW